MSQRRRRRRRKNRAQTGGVIQDQQVVSVVHEQRAPFSRVSDPKQWPEPEPKPEPDEDKTSVSRLTVDDPDFGMLWLQMQGRARRLWARYAPYMPSDELLTDWLAKLSYEPGLLPVWIITDASRRIYGHVVCEASVYHGQLFIVGHQLEFDNRRAVIRHKREIARLFVEWVRELNRRLAEQGRPERFMHFRFITPHNERFWVRWLPFEHIMTERTLTFAIPDVDPDEQVSE